MSTVYEFASDTLYSILHVTLNLATNKNNIAATNKNYTERDPIKKSKTCYQNLL